MAIIDKSEFAFPTDGIYLYIYHREFSDINTFWSALAGVDG